MAQKRGKKKGPPRKQDPAKDAAKRERRAERQRREAEANAQAAKRARRRTWGLRVLMALGAALVAIVVFNLAKPGAELEGAERPPNRGRGHLAQGETASYDSATPTSGPHAQGAAQCGIYATPLPLEIAVHDLEHGVVVVWYRPDLEDELLPDLRAFISGWDSHVIVSPNPGISDPIVATAWNRLMRFQTVEPGLDEFVDTYQKRGPESVPCDVEDL